MKKKSNLSVLEVMVPLGNGGVEQMIKYWVANLVSQDLHIDIVTPEILDKRNQEILESFGCNVFVLPFRQRKIIKRYKGFLKLFQIHNYDIVHVHTNSSLDFVALLAAKKRGIKVRIGHSHASALGNPSRFINIISKCFQPVFSSLCTRRLACSEMAGKFLFGKYPFEICRNGIDTEKYKYLEIERNDIRKELRIEDKKVIGSVANFMPEKNHELMLKILKELIKTDQSYILLLIGSGILMEEVEKEVKQLGLQEYVIFMGNHHDAYRYYSAMDLYVLCSHNEGFAVSAVEAQCNGLTTLIGGNLSKEMLILQNVYCVEEYSRETMWAKCIQKAAKIEEKDRKNSYLLMKDKGYDIRETVRKIEKEYQI